MLLKLRRNKIIFRFAFFSLSYDSIFRGNSLNVSIHTHFALSLNDNEYSIGSKSEKRTARFLLEKPGALENLHISQSMALIDPKKTNLKSYIY